MDEIANICHMEDKASKDRITCWKARRRYKISLKYGRKKEARAALRQLRRCGGFRISEMMKEIIWVY